MGRVIVIRTTNCGFVFAPETIVATFLRQKPYASNDVFHFLGESCWLSSASFNDKVNWLKLRKAVPFEFVDRWNTHKSPTRGVISLETTLTHVQSVHSRKMSKLAVNAMVWNYRYSFWHLPSVSRSLN